MSTRKEYNKIYYEKNKEYIRAYNKKYCEDNKIARSEANKRNYLKRKEKQIYEIVECECGSKIEANGMKSHIKTLIHQKYLDGKDKPIADDLRWDYGKIYCKCGGIKGATPHADKMHCMTQMHIGFLEG